MTMGVPRFGEKLGNYIPFYPNVYQHGGISSGPRPSSWYVGFFETRAGAEKVAQSMKLALYDCPSCERAMPR